MAKRAYIGVNNVAHKITKGYIGINNVAHKIKKAYIGIGGVARPCWSGGDKLEYYGTITPLSVEGQVGAATTIGNYALFGGIGQMSGVTVNAYDTSLTRSVSTDLSAYMDTATTIGDYALFGGSSNKAMNAYNRSLTRSIPTSTSTVVGAATTVGDYALFGGGSVVNAYDKSLTRSIPTAFSKSLNGGAATTVGNYAVFGITFSHVDQDTDNEVYVFELYNTSLTHSTTSFGRDAYIPLPWDGGYVAVSVGDYALFAGGVTSDYVIALSKSLTSSRISNLTGLKKQHAGTTIGDFALIGGGLAGDPFTDAIYATVDVYDKSLTHSMATDLSVERYGLKATTVGDYALFAGGRYWRASDDSLPYSANVDAYTLV